MVAEVKVGGKMSTGKGTQGSQGIAPAVDLTRDECLGGGEISSLCRSLSVAYSG